MPPFQSLPLNRIKERERKRIYSNIELPSSHRLREKKNEMQSGERQRERQRGEIEGVREKEGVRIVNANLILE